MAGETGWSAQNCAELALVKESRTSSEGPPSTLLRVDNQELLLSLSPQYRIFFHVQLCVRPVVGHGYS
jgi:hypothetical protein